MTTPREALIEKLLVTLHLTVPERQMLGSDDVTLAEVEAVVKRLLESDGVFPPDAKVWQRGEVVFEGVFLMKRADGKVQMTRQRNDLIKPCGLAEQATYEFDDLDQAVRKFILREWRNGIDGISFAPL